MANGPHTVVDLFSGAGGMSFGFHAHESFVIAAAADAEVGKPSAGPGSISCNATYAANIGVQPFNLDLSRASPADLKDLIVPHLTSRVDVLIACPPCTGFTRAVSKNYVEDDPRNSLVSRVADYVEALAPQVLIMENVPQLVHGNFRNHYLELREKLAVLGYSVHVSLHTLSAFGLPQQRKRAIIIAVKHGLEMRSLNDLWQGYQVTPSATTVLRAIGQLPAVDAGKPNNFDPCHASPALSGPTLERIRAIPPDGGSWPDLVGDPLTEIHLIPSMRKAVEQGRLNKYRDVYGRMAWNKPAPTIKRECSHVGNGRYSHPTQDRLCTVRELAILQGFPRSYEFVGSSLQKMCRQIGDAVPPLISYQLANVVNWILTGVRPSIVDILLPGTHLVADDVVATSEEELFALCS